MGAPSYGVAYRLNPLHDHQLSRTWAVTRIAATRNIAPEEQPAFTGAPSQGNVGGPHAWASEVRCQKQAFSQLPRAAGAADGGEHPPPRSCPEES